MDQLNEDNFTSFLNRNVRENRETNDGNKCVNFMRKKYKCIMIWMLSIISITQFLIIIFDKMDEKLVNKFFYKIYKFIKSNSTIENLLKNETFAN